MKRELRLPTCMRVIIGSFVVKQDQATLVEARCFEVELEEGKSTAQPLLHVA